MSLWTKEYSLHDMIYVLLGVVSPECLWRGLCGAHDTGSGRPRWHPTKFLLSVFHHPSFNFFVFFHFSAGSVFKLVIPRRSYSKVKKIQSLDVWKRPGYIQRKQEIDDNRTHTTVELWIWRNLGYGPIRRELEAPLLGYHYVGGAIQNCIKGLWT